MKMMGKEFTVRYLEEKLVFHEKTGDAWAYYEWIPYNYSCISEDRAESVFHGIKRLLARCGAEKIHLLRKAAIW